jgi:hypothetical protein
MALDGTWDVTIESEDIDPEIVPRAATLTLTTEGWGLTGSMQGPYPMGEDVVIRDATVTDTGLTWRASMRGERLRPQDLEFRANLEGTSMRGEVEVGIFGTASFTATPR